MRADAAYRFGAASLYLEPVATLAAAWTGIDTVVTGPNTITFEDDASVRARLGLTLGTSIPVFGMATIEPTLTASLWSELDSGASATLDSAGHVFGLADPQADTWGEISAGAHVLSSSGDTSAFAKIDLTFGEAIEGVAGKVGATVNW